MVSLLSLTAGQIIKYVTQGAPGQRVHRFKVRKHLSRLCSTKVKFNIFPEFHPKFILQSAMNSVHKFQRLFLRWACSPHLKLVQFSLQIFLSKQSLQMLFYLNIQLPTRKVFSFLLSWVQAMKTRARKWPKVEQDLAYTNKGNLNSGTLVLVIFGTLISMLNCWPHSR